MDWYDIKFLESPTNLKSVLEKSTGRKPSTNVATGISTCLQQGRFFFETAENSPLGIRPIQVFYGVVNFSKAIAAARNGATIGTLAQSHGIKDTSQADSLIENLTVKILQRGTFQDVNDAARNLESIYTLEEFSDSLQIFKPTSNSSELIGQELTFKEITSRLPHLSEIHEKTFQEKQKNQSITFHLFDSGLIDLQIDVPEDYHCRETLIQMVFGLREQYPFLNRWLFSKATLLADGSLLTFRNQNAEGVNEFSENTLIEMNGEFNRTLATADIIPFENILPPMSGGIVRSIQRYIQPIDGNDVSEYSILYMGTFLLSSLVRYKPDIWMHAVNGRNTSQRGRDDHCMALIESLLDNALELYPIYVRNCLETRLTN